MVATVQIISLHGINGVTEFQIDGGSMRFRVDDVDTVDATSPIPIPAAGTNYSWIKQCRFKATVTPANTINNLKFYSDGANGLGTGVDVLAKTYVSGNYILPSTQGTTQLSGTTTIFTYTSGSPLSVAGSITNPSTGLFGDIVAMQMSVTTTATQGTTPSETITFQFDES